ncbi:MAG: methyltransferase domain-containing protein [Candidatus Hermodarchaeota archaeon]
MDNYSFNNFANDYHSKRKKPWRPLQFFLNFLNKKGYVFKGKSLDLGCANGRNFKLMNNPPNKLIGIDISFNLLKIAKSNLKNDENFNAYAAKFFQLIQADAVHLPIREKSIDTIYSIATIHHIKKKIERKRAFIEMYDILKHKGNLILTVWRKWQTKFRDYFVWDWIKRNFTMDYRSQQRKKGLEEFGDKYVPWTLSSENITYDRFYHFFSKYELKKLMGIFNIKEFKITGGPTQKDNFFVFAQKT